MVHYCKIYNPSPNQVEIYFARNILYTTKHKIPRKKYTPRNLFYPAQVGINFDLFMALNENA